MSYHDLKRREELLQGHGRCLAKSPQGLTCGLENGHTGAHNALGWAIDVSGLPKTQPGSRVVWGTSIPDVRAAVSDDLREQLIRRMQLAWEYGENAFPDDFDAGWNALADAVIALLNRERERVRDECVRIADDYPDGMYAARRIRDLELPPPVVEGE